MKLTRRRTLALLFFSLPGAVTTAAAHGLFRLTPPPVYRIEGYLDRAPQAAEVVDRVEIFGDGKRKRWLLVTTYRAPGAISLDRYLSWPLAHTYVVNGKRADVDRLFGAASGAPIKGTFVVYAHAYPLLVISELESPPR